MPCAGPQKMQYDVEKIRRHILQLGGCHERSIECFDEIDSTNDYLLAQKRVEGKVCLAERQLRGRGRRGRPWYSGRSDSLLMSLGYTFRRDCRGLSLVSGLAIATSITELGADRLRLKWPNDIVIDGKKLCGILIELRGSNCIVGVGLNIKLSEEAGKTIDQAWIDLSAVNVHVDRDKLTARLIVHHDRLVGQFKKAGFSQFIHHWNALHIYHQSQVEVSMPGKTIRGIVRGVDKDGALIVRNQSGIVRVTSATASIRPLEKV